jgi:hypothetical protein
VWSGSLSPTAEARGKTDPVRDEDWTDAVAGYAERLHAAAGPDHHVVSALGAWLLVALCAPLADEGARSELVGVLGADPMEAAQFAAKLLGQPHPLVAAGVGMWMAPGVSTPAMEEWRAALPAGASTCDIPTQEVLDGWARERTSGLIERFAIQIDPDLVCLWATALATKVSWDVPFEVVAAAALAPSPWAATLGRVLRSPRRDPRHRQYVTGTDRAGTVGVHLAGARVVSSWARSSPRPRGCHGRRAGRRPLHRHRRSEGSQQRRPPLDNCWCQAQAPPAALGPLDSCRRARVRRRPNRPDRRRAPGGR